MEAAVGMIASRDERSGQEQELKMRQNGWDSVTKQ